MRIFKCKHPFEKSVKVLTHEVGGKTLRGDDWEQQYVVHMRLCGICGNHFIDEGFELTPKEGMKVKVTHRF